MIDGANMELYIKLLKEYSQQQDHKEEKEEETHNLNWESVGK